MNELRVFSLIFRLDVRFILRKKCSDKIKMLQFSPLPTTNTIGIKGLHFESLISSWSFRLAL